MVLAEIQSHRGLVQNVSCPLVAVLGDRLYPSVDFLSVEGSCSGLEGLNNLLDVVYLFAGGLV